MMITYLIDRRKETLPDGRWRDAGETLAKLDVVFRALVAAFPGAKVTVTTHVGDEQLTCPEDVRTRVQGIINAH